MQLVEQHVIGRDDPRYAVLDEAAFKAKNLYNAALYVVRQSFIFEKKYLNYKKMDKRMQQHEAYQALPRKVSQQVLKKLHGNWVSFFKQYEAYRKDPSKFRGRPKLPRYKHKIEGRFLLTYTTQALSRPALRQGIIQLSQLPTQVQTRQRPESICEIRIAPRNGHYVVEVVYEKEPVQANIDPSFCVGIDLGVTNLAAIASNRAGFVPRLVNGRPLKAWNQWYNKRMKELKAQLPKKDRDRVTQQMERITNKRNRRVNHYLHAASRRIVDLLVEQEVGTIIIGKNPLWKQEVNTGRRNNQNFVSIPHARFIDMLTYKAALVGIQVEIQEESYTSQASFLDLDFIPAYDPECKDKPIFSGKRLGKRNRLYRTREGRIICADVNGAYNTLRKRRPDAFNAEGIAAYVVQPLRLKIAV